MATPTPWGNEFLVNTITDAIQAQPAVTQLSNGTFVVAWADESGTLGHSDVAIHAQIFHADGSKAGAEFLVTTTQGDQDYPSLTALSNGGFVAAWNDDKEDSGGSEDIRAQVFNSDGSKSGGEFVVGSAVQGSKYNVHLSTLSGPEGRFVASWTDGGSDNEVHAQVFNPNGSTFGNEILVDTVKFGSAASAIAGLSDGRFVVTWVHQSNPMFNDIYAQIFNANGSPSSGPLVLTPAAAKDYDAPAVTALAGGKFAVTWEDLGAGGFISVDARVFKADGSEAASGFFPFSAALQYDPAIATLADGRFAVAATWAFEDSVVFVDVFNKDGIESGASFQVSPSQSDRVHQQPAICVLADGRLVVTWQDMVPGDGSDAGIRAQILDPRQTAVHLAGGALDDEYVGTKFNDDMKGGGGADHLDGGPGADALIGGPGDDHYVVDNPSDSVVESPGEGNDTVEASVSYVLPENVENLKLRDGAGPINGTGNALDNLIAGNMSPNVLDGADGNDRLIGGGGDDTLIGGGGDDTASFAHNFNDYTVMDFGGRILVSGPEGTDTLSSIEHLKFADATITPVDDGNPLFDSLYYLSRNADVFHAGTDALAHFDAFGWHEGRDPNPFFDVSGYLAANPDVAAAGINPLDHYHQSGWKEGRDPSADFDTTLYLIHNPDVAAAGVDPLAHYLAFGANEGRQAWQAVGAITAGFDAQYYLMHNPDVAAAGVDARAHFDSFGWHEGRNPNGWFDSAGYLSHYADVAAAGANPLEHYLQFGWKEGRDASAGLDTLGYLAANPDVAAAGVDPLEHFLSFGIYEGRQAVNDGLWH